MKGRLSRSFQKLFILYRDLQVWSNGSAVTKHRQANLQAWMKDATYLIAGVGVFPQSAVKEMREATNYIANT